MPSQGPKRGRQCYVTHGFLGVLNARCSEQNQKWPPTKGNKSTSGDLTPAFSGAQMRAAMLRHPCILGGPQQKRTQSEVAASPSPSRGPKKGRKCYVNPAFSGMPNAGRREQNQNRPPNKTKTEVVPNKEERNQKWLPPPCLLKGPKEGGNATSTLHSRGSPTPGVGRKIRSGPQQRKQNQ